MQTIFILWLLFSHRSNIIRLDFAYSIFAMSSSTAFLFCSNSAVTSGFNYVVSTFDLKRSVLSGTTTRTASSGIITAALHKIFSWKSALQDPFNMSDNRFLTSYPSRGSTEKIQAHKNRDDSLHSCRVQTEYYLHDY